MSVIPCDTLQGGRCLDMGCNVGGFTRCLLDCGALSVCSVDTGYGALEWDLRNDERVIVRERTNALHLLPTDGRYDFISIDLAWTRQSLSLPVAHGLIGERGIVASLLKPQYELSAKGGKRPFLKDERSEEVAREVFFSLPVPQSRSFLLFFSPVRGGRGSKGNREFWIVSLPNLLSDKVIEESDSEDSAILLEKRVGE